MYLSADTDERIQEVLDSIRSEDEEFDFNKVVPMPECLATMGSAPLIDKSYPLDADEDIVFQKTIAKAIEYDWQTKWEMQDDNAKFIERIAEIAARDYKTRQAASRRVKETGYPSWYEWAYDKWGTKWNSYHSEDNGPDSIKFKTAWSSPFAVIKALSEKFPDVEIKVEYADEDIGHNCGSFTLKGGEVVEEVTYPYGHDCINFCCDLWGYDDYNRAIYHCYCDGIDEPEENPEAMKKWGYVDEEREARLMKAQEAIESALALLEETDISDRNKK
jgi:hypothetical protein